MATGTLMTALLLLAAGQAADDILYTNLRNHKIPVSIEPARRQEIQGILLFVSADKGKTWQQQGANPPSKDSFVFYAPADGEFWFRPAVINRRGKQEPENIYQVAPANTQKMVIDTLKPDVKLTSVQRQGEEVVVSWEIQEEHPDKKTLELEYLLKDGSAVWTRVPLNPAATGQTRFKPATTGPLTVRMQFQDLAKNASAALAEVPGTSAVMPAGFNQGPAAGPPAVGPASAPAVPGATSVPPPPPPSTEVRPNLPPVSEHALPGTIGTEPPPPPPPDTRVVAANTAGVGPGAATTPFSGTKPLPTLQHVSNKEINLEYELSRVGPSGIGSVDLWWTPDDGKSWDKAPNLEVKDVVKNGRYQRTVELQEGDGIYGFSLVVRSRAGLGKPPPRPGDVPEIRIELDTVAPQVQLYLPRPDPQHRDGLILSWNAKDKNLAEGPITLEWSVRAEGDWKLIAANQPNTGQYSWQLPAEMPVQVYLRLRVRDLAGNEGVAVTPEPQLVDLTEPEGHLVNVSVSPKVTLTR